MLNLPQKNSYARINSLKSFLFVNKLIYNKHLEIAFLT